MGVLTSPLARESGSEACGCEGVRVRVRVNPPTLLCRLLNSIY